MARGGFPSMTALLGLLAVAGYQNRDRIAEMLRGGGAGAPPLDPAQPQQQVPPGERMPPGEQAPPDRQAGGLGGILGNLGGMLGGASAGSVLSGGLSEMLERFQQNGQGDAADSWIRTGPNQEIQPPQLEQAIGADVLDTLSKQTGLSREELLARLVRELPEAVNKYTPDGRLPDPA